MIYNELLINEIVFSKLLSFYKNNHLPNAFIFHGNQGIGKEAHAVEFFALLNCSNVKNNFACGDCPSCKKTTNLQHELLQIITPLPKSRAINKNDHPLKALNEKQKKLLIENYSKKGLNPYYKIKLEGSHRIIINSIKEIKKTINLSISDNKIRVFLILDAEKLCYPSQESANALLKILEEPKENNLFILVTSEINKIIDTIKSRCSTIFFPNISSSKIENYLAKQNIPDSKIISKISFGNIRYGLKINNSITIKMNSIQKMILALSNNNLKKWNNEFSHLDKNDIIENFKLLNLFFRDLEIIKNTNDLNFITFNNFKELYLKFLKQYNKAMIGEIIKNIDKAQNYMNINGYSNLIITALFIETIKNLKNEEYDKFELNDWVSPN